MIDSLYTGNELQVTSIETLKSYARGSVVALPPFAEGQPFYARIKRPSLMKLVERGTIPNSLLTKTNELFTDNLITQKNIGSENMMKDMYKIFDVICESTFIEPTYGQIKEAGIELTDEQYMFIFTYCQTGSKALESFRPKSEN